MPTRPSSSASSSSAAAAAASTLRGGRANLRNASVTFSLFRSTGPIAMARRRSVGPSVRPSVRPSVNTCNSATDFRIFFKFGGNIPWVNMARPFFRFCKILNFEFLKNKFQF